MNPPESNAHQHTNGQASPATSALPTPPGARSRGRSAARCAADDGIQPLPSAQENLAALQRMAEQTAELHRQFLEGQEKTQQTFLSCWSNSSG